MQPGSDREQLDRDGYERVPEDEEEARIWAEVAAWPEDWCTEVLLG